MNTRLALATAMVSLILAGCVSPAPREVPVSTWQLRPQLNPSTILQVYVQDSRLSVEIEKQPSTDFLYSGALFAMDGNARTIAFALGEMAVKFGGSRNFQVVTNSPMVGPAIIFTLQHWYSRTALKPEKPPVLVHGEFSGIVAFQRDGKLVASRQIAAKAPPVVVDMYIVFEREKRQTPRLIASAMERSANNAEQKGYAEIMNFLQNSWYALQSSQ